MDYERFEHWNVRYMTEVWPLFQMAGGGPDKLKGAELSRIVGYGWSEEEQVEAVLSSKNFGGGPLKEFPEMVERALQYYRDWNALDKEARKEISYGRYMTPDWKIEAAFRAGGLNQGLLNR